jgi:type II secretory pathway pseudopilin PulG
MNSRGFTKIELLVVAFLIVIVIAFDIAIVLYLNLKSRDIAVLNDIKQIQSGLDAYLLKNGEYPIAVTPIVLNDIYANTEKLCVEGFRKKTEKCNFNILAPIPNSDLMNGNFLKYQSEDGQSYKIEFILKTNFKAQGLSRGQNCASNNQIISQVCF